MSEEIKRECLPWRVVDNEDTGEVGALVVSANGVLIANCHPDSAMDVALPEDYKANARLFSDLPMLLNALAVVASMADDGVSNETRKAVMPKIGRYARAMLAKAGERQAG